MKPFVEESSIEWMAASLSISASADTSYSQSTVTYDGTTLTLNLLDGVTGDTFTMARAINIPLTVGANTAYVGFTGAEQTINATVPSSFALGWKVGVVQTQFQIDGLGTSGTSTVYLDNLTISRW